MAKVKEEYIPFKVLYHYEERREKYKQTVQKFQSQSDAPSDLVFIILEPHPKSTLPVLENCRFCCEADRSLAYLKEQICNKKLKINPNRSLYLYTGRVLLVGTCVTVCRQVTRPWAKSKPSTATKTASSTSPTPTWTSSDFCIFAPHSTPPMQYHQPIGKRNL